MNEISKEMEKGKSPGWIFAIKIPIFSPKSNDSPEDTQASAIAKLAPSRIMTSHANFCWTSFHLTKIIKKYRLNISVRNIDFSRQQILFPKFWLIHFTCKIVAAGLGILFWSSSAEWPVIQRKKFGFEGKMKRLKHTKRTAVEFFTWPGSKLACQPQILFLRKLKNHYSCWEVRLSVAFLRSFKMEDHLSVLYFK